MEKYIGELYSTELYALKKNRNCSFNLISLKCDTSYINYTFSYSFLFSCIFLGNKNTLVSLSINLKKFVKIIISTNFKRIWKAVRVSKFPLIDIIKNLVCVKNILDLQQNQFLKISKIKANKKFFYNFFNINLSISFNYPSVKKITNQYRRYAFGGIRNLFKSFENKSKKYLCGAVLWLQKHQK